MTEENEHYEQKTIQVKNVQQFEQMSAELLKNWTEYKKLDARMKTLDASVKKYMIATGLKTYTNEHGELNVVAQNRLMLDRSLIEDIEKNKVTAKVSILFKSANWTKKLCWILSTPCCRFFRKAVTGSQAKHDRRF